MNQIAEEMNELLHYGTPRHSGRYPWGSGEDPHQHGSKDFLGRIEELKKQGWSETPENIKKEFGITTTQYRQQKAIANNERRTLDYDRARSLKEDGLGWTEIGRQMGVSESTVRGWFEEKATVNRSKAKGTADFLKEQVKAKGMIDVGAGVELQLNVSKEKLNQALNMLEEEGYKVYGGRVEQATNPGKHTTLKVLCPPGTEHKEIFQYENIQSIDDYVTRDGGETFTTLSYPKSISSKRVKVLLADEIGPDGEPGVAKDGLIQIRRGVKDLSLGNDHYAQVRILVDDTKYLKGMAVYSDNMPDGVDIVFNSNKTSVDKAYKKIKDDPDNPFGALIKANGQSTYIDENGKTQLSAINKTRGEGDWEDWKDKLPSQFLSKQPLPMIKKQLGLAIADKTDEYEEICSYNNPTVKKHLLQSFADDCDKAAVHLQAAALPGQKYHVIIPINSLKDNEIYAPRYENGTQLALVRYPHAGTFEIPILTVNNKNPEARKTLPPDAALDAVGITHKVAARLSGADFDGDTVMCIPTNDKLGKVRVKSTPAIEGLEDFDTGKYAYSDEEIASGKARLMKGQTTQTQMGIVSNLITDMTLKGATTDELARAVKHSMVVIDAEKHKLNYKQSERDNGIAALKRKYQSGGASTLISRAKSEVSVDKRIGTPKVNIKGKDWYDPDRPEGALVYNYGKKPEDLEYTYTKTNKKTGEVTTVTKKRTQQSTRMAETDDAYSLVSDMSNPKEMAYADYANKMKALANQARKEMLSTGKIAYNANAKAVYEEEVRSLNNKVKIAELNAPRERKAQLLANVEVENKKAAYKEENGSEMKKGDARKLAQQALKKYREVVGAKRTPVDITDREWEAIQSGAVSEAILKNILKHTDIDKIKERAMPRNKTTLTQAKINKIKQMRNSNYSLEDIARACGVPVSTVTYYLKGVK